MEDTIALVDHLVLVSLYVLVIVGPCYILSNARKTQCSNIAACENQFKHQELSDAENQLKPFWKK